MNYPVYTILTGFRKVHMRAFVYS